MHQSFHTLIHQLIFIHSLHFIPSFHPLIDEPIIHQLTISPFILWPSIHSSISNSQATHYICIHFFILSPIIHSLLYSLHCHPSFNCLIHQPTTDTFTSSSIPPSSHSSTNHSPPHSYLHPFILVPITHSHLLPYFHFLIQPLVCNFTHPFILPCSHPFASHWPLTTSSFIPPSSYPSDTHLSTQSHLHQSFYLSIISSISKSLITYYTSIHASIPSGISQPITHSQHLHPSLYPFIH